MLGALLMERVSRRKTTEVLAESHSFRRFLLFRFVRLPATQRQQLP